MTLWGKSDVAPQSGARSYESMLRLERPKALARFGNLSAPLAPGFARRWRGSVTRGRSASRSASRRSSFSARSPTRCTTSRASSWSDRRSSASRPRAQPADSPSHREATRRGSSGSSTSERCFCPSDVTDDPELCAADGADSCAPGAARRLHSDVVARPVRGERTAERRLR
jgi:hypothetical protein